MAISTRQHGPTIFKCQLYLTYGYRVSNFIVSEKFTKFFATMNKTIPVFDILYRSHYNDHVKLGIFYQKMFLDKRF